MDIVIEGTSDKPIYQQLYEQISAQIIKGELEGDYSLPSIRTAAKELRVSIITVKKAWETLENQGFIYTVAGKGCFVSHLKKSQVLAMRDELTDQEMSKHIQYYKALGLSQEEVIDLIKKHY